VPIQLQNAFLWQERRPHIHLGSYDLCPSIELYPEFMVEMLLWLMGYVDVMGDDGLSADHFEDQKFPPPCRTNGLGTIALPREVKIAERYLKVFSPKDWLPYGKLT